jgi:hypothetical protein
MLTIRCVVLCFLLFIATNIFAQNESYIFLETIKGIPCKIKLNGAEQTNLGKNYMIMPLVTTGENTVVVDFAGNLFPSQVFVIDAKAASSYGYKLAKAGEDKFYLIDLVNTGKIIETNSNVNIGLSTDNNVINFTKPIISIPIVTIDKNKTVLDELPINEMPEKAKKTVKKKKKKSKTIDSSMAKQINELSSEIKPNVDELKTNNATLVTNDSLSKPLPRCAKVSSDKEITFFIDKLKQKSDDESKLILVKKKIFTGCITSTQLGQIAENFETQYGRFSTVKFLFPELADPDNKGILESLFRYDSYKSKLKKL